MANLKDPKKRLTEKDLVTQWILRDILRQYPLETEDIHDLLDYWMQRDQSHRTLLFETNPE